MLFRPTEHQPDRVPASTYGVEGSVAPGKSDRHTLGSIIWFAMLRLVATIFVAWYLQDHIHDLSEWWMITIAAIYGIAIYPAQIQYSYFRRTSRRLIEQTLCSSCRHFNPDGLHCTLLDEHVTEKYLPCNAEGWEPTPITHDLEP